MGKCIVQVYPTAAARAGWDKVEFVLLETEFADFAQVARALDEGRVVCASKLHVYKHDGNATIYRRTPMAITRDAVARMELPQWTFVEKEG